MSWWWANRWWATKEDVRMIVQEASMASLQEVLDAVGGVKAAVDAAAERVIADLQGVITPEQLDGVRDSLDTIKAAADAIDPAQ